MNYQQMMIMNVLTKIKNVKCVSNLLVCRGLIQSGERQDEENVAGRHRTEALRQLCQMNPSQAFNIRAMVVRIHS